MDRWFNYGRWCCLANLDKKMNYLAEAIIVAAVIVGFIIWGTFTIFWMWGFYV